MKTILSEFYENEKLMGFIVTDIKGIAQQIYFGKDFFLQGQITPTWISDHINDLRGLEIEVSVENQRLVTNSLAE